MYTWLDPHQPQILSQVEAQLGRSAVNYGTAPQESRFQASDDLMRRLEDAGCAVHPAFVVGGSSKRERGFYEKGLVRKNGEVTWAFQMLVPR